MRSTSRRRRRAVAARIRGLTKHFGSGEQRVQALRGIDWDVYTGQMTLIVGPSGCGKTTLLSVIAGILDATRDVSIFGNELTTMGDRSRTRFRAKNIGFVFQQYNLLPALTAAENAAIPLVIAGWAKERAVARPARSCESIGMGQEAGESAQPAFGRPDAAGRDRPGPGARAAAPGLRRADRRARPRDRASPSWSFCARRPFVLIARSSS